MKSSWRSEYVLYRCDQLSRTISGLKNPGHAGVLELLLQCWVSIVAVEGAQDVQQADEQVVDVQVKACCRKDVVGLATVHDAAGVIQDEARHQQHDCSADRQAEHAHIDTEQAEIEVPTIDVNPPADDS